MVLLTLLGLCAYFLTERKDDNVDQSDDGEPSNQDITSDPELCRTADGPITGDPEVCRTAEGPITGDPDVCRTADGPITGDPEVCRTADGPITGDPEVCRTADGPITGDPELCRTADGPITGDPEVCRTADGPITGDPDVCRTADGPITGDPEVCRTADGPITGDPEVCRTADGPITGDPEVCRTADGPITGDPEVCRTADRPITGDPEVCRTADGPITGDPEVCRTADGPITGDPDVCRTADRPITGDPEVCRTADGPITGDPEVCRTADGPITGDPEVCRTADRPITGDPEVCRTADGPITGDPEVCRTADGPITGDPDVRRTADGPITGDSEVCRTADESITGDPEVCRTADGLITGNPEVCRTADGPITGDPEVCRPADGPITGDPEVCRTADIPITGDPEVNEDWNQDQSLKDSNTGDPQVDDYCSDDDVYYSLPEDTDAPRLSQQQDNKRKTMGINSFNYEIDIQLSEGGFGTVNAATRLEDNLQVAVKFATKEHVEYVSVDGYSRPVPMEVAMHVLANKEPRVPHIIQLLDWQDEADGYIMVLERPMPCQTLDDFLRSYTGDIDEDLARVIMRQVVFAAQACCRRGVFHRDIKLENLLINPNTLEVKLFEFGCGEILNYAGYTSFAGTDDYCPPEYWTDDRYHGEPATVWSLGIILFVMLCGDFPKRRDLYKIFKKNTWTKDGLSQECCDFICCCLQDNPKKRIELEKVSLHNWLKIEDVETNNGTIMESCDFIGCCLQVNPKKRIKLEKANIHKIDNVDSAIMAINSFNYEIGNKLGQGSFGNVYEATRLKDNLQVAVKLASREDAEYVRVDGYSRPVPMEVAMHVLANKEPRVPHIIQLLDWQDEADGYIMVLERPMPCQTLNDFLWSYTDDIDEDLARVIMRQVVFAAQACCRRGVFHRDIKLENLLINPNTLEVILIDFGISEILTSAGYKFDAGTDDYCPPECWTDDRYHGEPATVWSLGIILFVMLHEYFPSRRERYEFKENTWTKDGLSQECCDFFCCCLQDNPKKRIELEKVSLHNWLKIDDVESNNRAIMGFLKSTESGPYPDQIKDLRLDTTTTQP